MKKSVSITECSIGNGFLLALIEGGILFPASLAGKRYSRKAG